MRIFKNDRGIALVLVLWVVTLLSVIVGEFCQAMRTEANITGNFKDETEAYYLAEAGLNRAIFELIRSAYPPSGTQTAAKQDEEQIRWRINAEIPAIPFGQGAYEVRIDNEGGKININTADERLLGFMLNSFNLEEEQKRIITDSILDWRDPDDLHRLNGAENDYYRALPEPYSCKNDYFDTVDELLLVRGITPDIFYGGLRDMVTVYYDKQFESAQGRRTIYNKINFNAAPEQVLRLMPQMTEDIIAKIREHRKEKDFTTFAELLSILGNDAYVTLVTYITLQASPYFTISATGTVKDTKVRRNLQAVVQIDRTLQNGYRVVNWREGQS